MCSREVGDMPLADNMAPLNKIILALEILAEID